MAYYGNFSHVFFGIFSSFCVEAFVKLLKLEFLLSIFRY